MYDWTDTLKSLVHPDLGKADTPYARTVAPKHIQPRALPDPGVLFDSLMSRKVPEEHPAKISSVLFYLASIIIHDCFRTDRNNYWNSKTSSYLDLAPLYGSNKEEQELMRTHKDGKIWPDCFSEKRLLNFPPGVGVLLIMFNRFHNYVVEQLALINEGGKFRKGSETSDEDLFQTGRLVTCGLYVNIILIDYVRTILNLNKTNSNWQLNPRAEVKGGLPMGTGNQVSAEFNLVYRWHSTVSKRDEEWSKKAWEQMFPGRDPKSVCEREFLMKLKELDEELKDDPRKWPFAELQRTESGSFKDDDLVRIMKESIEDCANSFGAQRVPTVMRAIEVLGIQQARAWNLGTLNEFRKYFGLTPHDTWSDISSDKHVQEQLMHLYDHPDNVEIYPGIVVEDAKRALDPGSGLAPGYTISRAVLSDAVALVRGDRFYTIDYHPKKLTNWGYSEVQFNMEIDNGCMFYKLFARAFPDHFESNSVYAHYPLTIPKEMEHVLGKLGRKADYSYETPKYKGATQTVFSYKACKAILSNQKDFHVAWGVAMEFLMGEHGKDFMLAGDGPENAHSRKMVGEAIYVKDWASEVRNYYEETTKELLRKKSYRLGDDLNQVDIIRDVGNLAHVHFGSDLWMLPLKTEEHKLLPYTEHEMYLVMAAMFTAIFYDLDPGSSFAIRQKAKQLTQSLGKLVLENVKSIQHHGILSAIMQRVFPEDTTLKLFGRHLIERLLEKNTDTTDLVWGHIMGTVGGMIPNQGQLFAQVIEYYLTTGKEHLKEINRLAKSDKPEDFDKLTHYMLEGARLGGETGVLRYATCDIEIEDAGRILKLEKGSKLLVNMKSASHDPAGFPDPETVDLTRDIESYIHLGYGLHKCLGFELHKVSLTAMLKVIGQLDNLRPAKGPQGKVQKVSKPFGVPEVDKLGEKAQLHTYLTEDGGSYFPFPCCKSILLPFFNTWRVFMLTVNM